MQVLSLHTFDKLKGWTWRWINRRQKNFMTCADGFHHFGIMFSCQQRLIVARVLVQLLLSATCCHPDQTSVLIGDPFANIALYWEKVEVLVYIFYVKSYLFFYCCCWWLPLTLHILINFAFSLQQCGPLDRSSGEYEEILRHELLIWIVVKICRALKTIWIHTE